MKKIGIITFHRADNLGAVLQAYALQTVLRENWNTDAQIIDYVCPCVEKSYKKGHGITAILVGLYHFWKHQSIEKFRRKNLILSEQCTSKTINRISESYDIFVTGSDQIWNYECSGWDDAYFLDFVSGNKEKYSYAASIGNYCFDETERHHVRQLLQGYSSISVRESSAQEVLESLGIQQIVKCPDPVVLLPVERWEMIMQTRRCRQRYVFVYLIQQDVNVMRNAQIYAAEHHCKIISNKTSPEFILHGGPEDFLSWIYHAECVFTNSFHATAFSLIFKRPLAADVQLKNGGTNYRVQELLEFTGAIRCVISADNITGQMHNADDAIRQMRVDAFEYLDQICMGEQ